MHAFDVRRIEWALTEGDRLVDSDPLQSSKRWTLVSMLLGALLIAVVGVLGVVRGHLDWRAAELVLETDSGALFLNRDGVLHPVPNYTSALLAGSWGGRRPEPRAFSAVDLADAPRGSQLGIVGAPSRLPVAEQLVSGAWSVCGWVGADGGGGSVGPADSADSAGSPGAVGPAGGDGPALVAGRPAPGRRLSDDEAVLVVARAGPASSGLPGTSSPEAEGTAQADASPGAAGSTSSFDTSLAWLIWAGQRHAVDLADPVVVGALRLTARQPSQLDAAVFGPIPDGGPLAVPDLPGRGELPAFGVIQVGVGRTLLVGDVFVVSQMGAFGYYVVHRDGIEQISETVAELLRFSASTEPELPAVGPAVLARAPVTAGPIEGTLPGRLPTVREADAPVLCAEWDRGRPEGHRWAITVSSAPPPSTIEVPGALGAGVRRVGMGAGALVRSGPVGNGAAAPVYYVSELGITFPLVGEALTELGFAAAGTPDVPGELLDLLPKGPTLEPVKS